jgi:hypothetical protein
LRRTPALLRHDARHGGRAATTVETMVRCPISHWFLTGTHVLHKHYVHTTLSIPSLSEVITEIIWFSSVGIARLILNFPLVAISFSLLFILVVFANSLRAYGSI